MQLTPAKLRKWNLGVGIFQLFTGAVIFGITDYDLKTPLYTFFIASRDADEIGFYVPEPNRVWNAPIGALSGIFLLLSAIDHLAVILPGLNKVYLRELCANRNKFRWLEYSVSASAMRVQIAMLSGAIHAQELYAIFGLAACTMLFGWLMESINGTRLPTYNIDGQEVKSLEDVGMPGSMPKRKIDWTPLIMGFVAHAFSWTLVLCHFFQTVKNGDPPAFVWAIIFILFFLDLTFAVVQILQFAGVLKGFAKAEFCYIILSLTAKQLLAWIEFVGVQSLNQ